MPAFLEGLDGPAILERLRRAPGNEVKSGKIAGPESGSALVANAFGRFLTDASALPPMPGVPAPRALSLDLAVELPLPWNGTRNPFADVFIESATTLVAVLSRRYEPFRPARAGDFADIQEREAWATRMPAHTGLRRAMVAGQRSYRALDAHGLIRAAYGLCNLAEKRARAAVLVYLYAEPPLWANGKALDPARLAAHRAELADYARRVKGDAVVFAPLRWSDLLADWGRGPLAAHAAGLNARFGPLSS